MCGVACLLHVQARETEKCWGNKSVNELVCFIDLLIRLPAPEAVDIHVELRLLGAARADFEWCLFPSFGREANEGEFPLFRVPFSGVELVTVWAAALADSVFCFVQ